MRLFEIDDPTRFFTLVVCDEVFHLLELVKKSEWKIYNKNLIHVKLKIRFEKHDLKYETFIDDYFLFVSREEQEAINYQVEKTYKKYEEKMHILGFEKLKQELKKA